ncbi:hypothetical protein RND81_06G188300 [Saponaria officinalis]|uniref:CMP/dCMP-type deaminase domain-containing protein n=1 Tax=Saponaria officinalis TaxID=3572 RepID=A0AAW1KEQ5_SAPOF
MDHLKFVIESSEADLMVKQLGLDSVLELLPLIARSARKSARQPISGFAQFLITNLSRFPHCTLKNVVVSTYPCGHCRQFLQEVRGASGIQIFVLQNHGDDDEDDGKPVKINGFLEENHNHFRPLSYFLPHQFGPNDLLDKDVPLILETRENGLILVDDLIIKGENGLSSAKFDLKRVVIAALDAANRSHAPYSGCPSGISLVDKNGNIFKGSYMESAAYNPSFSPMQAAVIDYIATTANGAEAEAEAETGYGNIIGAVGGGPEEGAVVKQEETAKLFLMAVSPNCEFHVYNCKIDVKCILEN